MKDKFQNLFSRKFLLSALIVLAGVGAAFKGASDPKVQIIGIVAACVAAVVYAWVEGSCDKAAITQYVAEAIDDIEKIKEESEVNDNE